MRVLVTGAAGFAGRHLCRLLLERGHEVTGLLRRTPPPDLRLPGLRVLEANLLDAEAVERAVERSRPERVFHLAALTHLGDCEAAPRLALEVNAGGTRRLLGALERHAPGARVVLASSCHVYGRPRELPLREEHPLEGRGAYARSKVAAEEVAREAAASGLAVVVARAFHHCGPGQSPRFALADWARQLARGGPVRVGRLELWRDYTDVRDVVRGYVLLAERGEPGRAYNLCSGRARRLDELLRLLVGDTPVEREASRERPAEVPCLLGDPSRARALGWEPRVPLEQSLAELREEARRAVAAGGEGG